MKTSLMALLLVVWVILAGLAAFVLTGTRTKSLTNLGVSAPSVSRTGELMVFDIIHSGEAWVVRYDRSTRSMQELTPRTLRCHHPILSPTGSNVFFSRLDGNSCHIWAMTSDGQQMRQVTRGRVIDTPLTISQDGSALYFRRENWHYRFGTPVYEVWKISLGAPLAAPHCVGPGFSINASGEILVSVVHSQNGLAPAILVKEVTKERERHECDGYVPDISPDGTSIAYTRPGTNWNTEIWIKDTAKGFEQVLDSSPGIKSAPRFSPDGKQVTFRLIALRDGEDAIVGITLTNRTVQRISLANLPANE